MSFNKYNNLKTKLNSGYALELDSNLLSISNTKSKYVKETEMITKSYDVDTYAVEISTDSNTNIFMKITNKKTYQNYETTLFENDLESNLNITQFVKIITNSFENKVNYFQSIELQSDSITIHFIVKFDGFYDISQSIELREKQFGQDKLATVKINELETRIRELESQEILFGHHQTNYNDFIKIKLNTNTIDFTKWISDYSWYGNYWDFNKLTNLKKIILYSNQLAYNFKYVDFKLADYPIENMMTNGWGINCPNISTNATVKWTQLNMPNIFDSTQLYFPNINEIIICFSGVADFNSIQLRSLPKLKKVIFREFGNNQLFTFEFIKKNNIKHIVYNNCLNIVELELIKNYFATNNFILEITK